MLRGEGVLEELRALLRGGGGEVEVLYMGERRGMSRFYRSNPHQGGEVEDVTLFLRTILPGHGGSRVGVVSLHSLGRENLRRSLERSRALAEAGEPVSDLTGLPSPQEAGSSLERGDLEELYDEETGRWGPEERARVISEVFGRAEEGGGRATGCLTTSQGEIALVNSRGLERYGAFSLADFSLIMEAGDCSSSGFACAASRKVKEIDFFEYTRRALEKCALARDPRPLEPGSYRVVLEPPAVAEILIWLSFIGFGAKAYLEGRAFSSGRLGERLMGERVTIMDDALEPRGLPFPFDFEGVRRRPVTLIERGVMRDVVWDSLWGARGGHPSTGHAPPPGHTFGPMPMNLVMDGGDTPREELLSLLGSGLLISRFHYVNGFLEPRSGLMTGMTRDGTFWVEAGEISHAVRNLRFTQGILEAFSRIEALSRERELVPLWGGSCLVPALLIDGFEFTGTTD